MTNTSNVIAIIPARGGSKRIPCKNVRKIAGKPLIAYSVEVAKKSKYLKKVLVSTDDKEIADTAKLFGAEVPFLRPKELAKDDTPTLSVLQHAVRYLENAENLKVDIVVLLQPTSPIRTVKYIDSTIKKIIQTGADSVVTVCKIKQHPFWSFVADGDKLSPFSKEGINLKQEDLPIIYALNGSVYAIRRSVLFDQNSIFGSDTRAVVMPQEESIDVDDFFDLFMAEMVLKHWKNWFSKQQSAKKDTAEIFKD